MSYDARDRLTSMIATQLGSAAITFTYDPLDNLRTYTTPARVYTHEYDPTTWRLTRIRDAANATMYAYQYAGAAGTRGNVTTRNKQSAPTALQNFSFDFGNRMRQLSGTTAESYQYDGLGLRTVVVNGASLRHTVYSASGLLMYETQNAVGSTPASTTRYLYLGRHVVGRVKTTSGVAQTTFSHTDGLGSPVAETSASGTVTWRTWYEPYGLPIGSAPVQGPAFTGHVADASTGLHYMQQRYYDPVAGRFLSVDPVGADPNTGANFNRYWYANNNPYKFTDPDGRYVCKGSASDCGMVSEALKLVEKAASNPSNTASQSDRLNKVVGFYGAAGDDNGVTVKISDSSTGVVGGGASTSGGKATIGVEMRAIEAGSGGSSSASFGPRLGGVMAHEGQHGIDQRSGGMPKSRSDAKRLELGAYGTEGLFYKAINLVPAPHRLWSPVRGIDEDAVDRAADRSTKIWCGLTSAEGC